MHFGELLKKLRTERGLTQSQLAVEAGASPSTIQRAEYSEASPLKRSTARQLFDVLSRHAAVDPDSAAAYFKASGLEARLGAMAGVEGRRAQALAAYLATLDDEREVRAALWLQQLVEDAGVERVLDALRGMAAMVGTELLTPAAETRELRVVHPPRQGPGYVEEKIEHITVRDPKPGAKPKASRRDRRAE